MPTQTTEWSCQKCGATAASWIGRCDVCGAFSSYVETPSVASSNGSTRKSNGGILPLGEVISAGTDRLATGIKELDCVLGGGFVRGSVVLLGGEPGVGKSTILMQACVRLAETVPVIYLSAEETVGQIRLRAERLGAIPPSLRVTGDSNIVSIVEAVQNDPPGLLVVDSIQTVYTPTVTSSPGSVSQVRECGSALIALAKSTGVPIVLVGHVTRDGTIAGPRVLEHMVDTVLYFDSGENHTFRILRAIKNRFGSSSELGIFEMSATGLRAVDNPSRALLAERRPNAPGSVVSSVIEGSRAFLVEIQSLVMPSYPDTEPKRHFEGVDSGRCAMLMAVLERLGGIGLSGHDIYVSVAGGFEAKEPAVDLAICLAVTSALSKRAFDSKTVAVGEVGLLGEVRSVPMLPTRLAEAQQLGFANVVVPKGQAVNLGTDLSLSAVATLTEGIATVSNVAK